MNLAGYAINFFKNAYTLYFAKKLLRSNGINVCKWDVVEATVFIEIFFKRTYSYCFPFNKKCTIVDIGSHKGYFALYASRNVAEGSKIYAIEPEAENFRVLTNNLKMNSIDNVTPCNSAIAGSTGQRELYITNSVNHTLFKNDQKGDIKKVVNTLSFFDFCKNNNIDSIDFLKVDCEGAEYEIIESINSELVKKIKTIAIEFHDLQDGKNSSSTIIDFLRQNGFTIIKYNFQQIPTTEHMGIIIATR